MNKKNNNFELLTITEFLPPQQIECTVYAGSILEYCVVQSFGAVASSALNIAEKVLLFCLLNWHFRLVFQVELVVNLMRILRVKSGNPSTISAILSEVCENAEFTNRFVPIHS